MRAREAAAAQVLRLLEDDEAEIRSVVAAQLSAVGPAGGRAQQLPLCQQAVFRQMSSKLGGSERSPPRPRPCHSPITLCRPPAADRARQLWPVPTD
jgi:hypothetical protein